MKAATLNKPTKTSVKELVFLQTLRTQNLPAPVKEHLFHDRRKWRFDYAWPECKIALELEGGIWTKGRHTRGKGFVGDMEKYNEAALHGWMLLRIDTNHLANNETINWLKRAFENRISNETSQNIV